MYLEISGRGSGKTWRLIQAVSVYLATDDRNIANIIVTGENTAEWIQKTIERAFHLDTKRIRYTPFNRENAIVRGYANVRNFFDEFDQMTFDFNKDGMFFYPTTKEDYYVTTANKIRNLESISIQQAAKKDFLLRLLLENGGMYTSFVHPYYDPSWAKPLKEKWLAKDGGAEEYAREFEGKFVTY